MERYLFPKTPDDDGRSDGLTQDQLNELIGRLNGVYEDLLDYANAYDNTFGPLPATHPELVRARGKSYGVRLALSYIEEITRENHNAPE